MVTRQDKRLAVGRLGALVEQIEALVSKDLQVILVRHCCRPFLCVPGVHLQAGWGLCVCQGLGYGHGCLCGQVSCLHL